MAFSLPKSFDISEYAGRDRRRRNADVHRAEREQGVVDAVVGEDGDRLLRVQAAFEQRLRDAAHRAVGFAIASVSSSRRPCALRQERALRRVVGPLHQPLGDAACVGRRASAASAAACCRRARFSTSTFAGASLMAAMREQRFAGGDAAAMARCAFLRTASARPRADARQGVLELAQRPLQSLDQELDALARLLHGDGLVVELAGGVAVGRARALRASRRSSRSCAPRRPASCAALPTPCLARPVVHEGDQRLGSRALGLEHAVEELDQLFISEV